MGDIIATCWKGVEKTEPLKGAEKTIDNKNKTEH